MDVPSTRISAYPALWKNSLSLSASDFTNRPDVPLATTMESAKDDLPSRSITTISIALFSSKKAATRSVREREGSEDLTPTTSEFITF